MVIHWHVTCSTPDTLNNILIVQIYYKKNHSKTLGFEYYTHCCTAAISWNVRKLYIVYRWVAIPSFITGQKADCRVRGLFLSWWLANSKPTPYNHRILQERNQDCTFPQKHIWPVVPYDETFPRHTRYTPLLNIYPHKDIRLINNRHYTHLNTSSTMEHNYMYIPHWPLWYTPKNVWQMSICKYICAGMTPFQR